MKLSQLFKRKPIYICADCKKLGFFVKLVVGDKCRKCGSELEWPNKDK